MDWSFEHGMTVRRIGAGPELVWIHGLGEWSVSFDPIARHPALAGFRHVLPDLPGYGRSPWPALGQGDSLERHADVLAAWIGSRAPILVGHSMGGVLATMVAERIAVRAVVDVEGNLSGGDCRFSGKAAAYSLDDFVARGFDAVRAQIHAQSATDPALRGYHAALTAASPEQLHRDALALIAVSQAETLARRLAALACPALFVAGVPGGVCEHSRALLDREGVRWLGIEPAGHWVWIDQPGAFAAAVAAFVTS